jgi:hypothetical protein
MLSRRSSRKTCVDLGQRPPRVIPKGTLVGSQTPEMSASGSSADIRPFPILVRSESESGYVPPKCSPERSANRLICPTSDFQKSCQSLNRKIFRFSRRANQVYVRTRPAFAERGASRSSRTLRRDAMDVFARKTSGANADGEGVWSWPPDAGVKSCDMSERRRGLSSPAPRGERAISRNTIVQGRPARSAYLW